MSPWELIATFWQTGWDAHPERVALFVLMLALYAASYRRLGPDPSGARHAWWFALGMVLLVLSVQSPLHHLADRYLFSAHMLQHQALTLIVPPLLLFGIPPGMGLGVLRKPWLIRIGHSPGYVVAAFGIFNLLFALIHAPAIYDAIFASELAHFFTHAALLGTALLTWLPLFSPWPEVFRRLPLPGQLLYCVAQTIPGSLIGSLIALSEQVVYRHYGTQPLALGVDPLSDQSIGGLFMWVGTGTFFLGLLTILFFVWADREERQVDRGAWG
jgi:putative membrane protein